MLEIGENEDDFDGDYDELCFYMRSEDIDSNICFLGRGRIDESDEEASEEEPPFGVEEGLFPPTSKGRKEYLRNFLRQFNLLPLQGQKNEHFIRDVLEGRAGTVVGEDDKVLVGQYSETGLFVFKAVYEAWRGSLYRYMEVGLASWNPVCAYVCVCF